MATDEKNKPSVDELLKQAVDYVGKTQPIIDKVSAADTEFRKQAERTVGVLVDRGIVLREKSDAFVQKVAEDHSYALRMCEKLASMLEVDSLGDQSSEKVASDGASESMDPFVAAFAPDLIGSGVARTQQL